MTEPAPTPADTVLAGWWANPDRTLVATRQAGPAGALEVLRLDRAGHAATHQTLPEFAGWDVLGWASTGVLALWHRQPGGSELRLVDVTSAGTSPAQHSITGRPVTCRMDSARRVAVVVAMSIGGQAQLWLHAPHRQTYQRITLDAAAQGVGAWDYQRRILAVNLDVNLDAADDAAGVAVFRDGGSGPAQVDVAWPGGVRPTNAAGCGAGRVGLTGLTGASGEPIPGVLDAATRTVRWFRAHAGYSCVDVGPSGRHLLVTRWNGESFDYRVLNAAGDTVGEFGTGAAIVSDPSFAAGETHTLALHQSPASPPSLRRWEVRTGAERPVLAAWPPARRATAGAGLRWELRRWTDPAGRQLPEWVFTPTDCGHGGTVLYLHGGPHGRLNQAYDPVLASFAGAGWTVIGMNYPGSSGYGTEYMELTRGDWGGADADAVEWRLRSLSADGAGPVCLYGQSYGGYLALLAAAALPDLLDSTAVWAPVTDIPALLDTTNGSQRRWLVQDLGGLAADPQQLWQRSPVSRLAGLRDTTLLVGHGRLDERCPVEQSRRLVHDLQRPHGGRGSVDFLEDPDSPHTPHSWRRWAAAAVAHFGRRTAPANLTFGGTT